MATIYSIKNTVNGKIYVGSTTDYYQRICTHKADLRSKVHHNVHLQRAWHRYGEESFEFSVIEECEESILCEREQHWMDFFKCADKKFGYNICPDAKHHKVAEETKRKLSKAKMGVPVLARRGKKNRKPFPPSWYEKRSILSKKLWQDPEYRTKIVSSTKKLWDNPEYVKKQVESQRKVWTPEKREEHSHRTTQIQSDPEYRKRMSERCKGISKSEETKAKMKEAAKNRKPISEETREKIRLAQQARRERERQ